MKLGPLGTPWACAILALCVLVAFCVVGSFAYATSGTVHLATAAIAAGICWLSGTLALLVTGSTRNSPHRVTGTLIASAMRFGVPLVSGVTLKSTSEELAASGIFGWIVVFYLLVLAIETPLSVLVVGTRDATRDRGIATHG